MTKKDFELIAAILRTFTKDNNHWLLCLAFAVRLAQVNPRFDAKRFALACGPPADDASAFAGEVKAMAR